MRWIRAVLAIASLLLVGPAVAGFHGGGGGVVSDWNGSLVQFNLGTVSPFPFVDLEKSDTVNFVSYNRSYQNQYGWPDSYAAMSGSTRCGVAGTAWRFNPSSPTQTERSGSLTMDWVGCAQVNFTFTVSGSISITQNACSGSCSQPCTVSGNLASGTNCSVVFTPSTTAGPFDLESVGDGTTDPQLTQLRIYYTADASLVNTCYLGIASSNETQLQSCFNPQYLTSNGGKLAGVIRFVNAMGENVSPNSFQSTWEQNTPLTYRFWTGNLDRQVPGNYTPSQITAATGGSCTSLTVCFTVAFTGFSLTDRATVIAQVGSTITTPTGSPSSNVAATSCTTTLSVTTCVIPFSSGVPSYAVPGQILWDSQPSGSGLCGCNPLSPTVYIVSVDNVGNTITIGCQEENTAAGCLPIATGKQVSTSDNIYFDPLLNVNGTGYVPMASTGGNGIIAGASTGHAEIFMYDADLKRFITNLNTGSSNRGIVTGWPAEIMVAYANAIGANPYYNVPCYAMGAGSGGTITTDWVSSSVTFNKANLASGLIPFWEGTDETWNNHYTCNEWSNTVQYWRTGSLAINNSVDNWYGEEISNVGQIVSVGYGNPSVANRFKYYRVIDGMSAYGANSGMTSATAFTGSGGDGRLYYSGDGNQPAYKWVTDASVAVYYGMSADSSVDSLSASSNSDANGGQLLNALGYAYNLSPSTTLIGTYFNSTNNSAGTNFNLYKNVNTLYPDFSGYLGQYVSGGGTITPVPIHFIAYEGGGHTNNLGGPNAYAPIASIVTGATTTLNTTSSNAWNIICGSPYSLCGASGPSYVGNPTTTIAGVCSEMQGTLTASISGTTLTVTAFLSAAGGLLAPGSTITVPGGTNVTIATGGGGPGGSGTYTVFPSQSSVGSESMTATALDYPVISAASATTVVIAAATDSGCTYSSGGTATYDGSGTLNNVPGYIKAFQIAAYSDTTSTNFESCEIANFQEIYAIFNAAGVTPEFPAIYDMSESGEWALGRFWQDMSVSAGPTMAAVQSFNASQTGHLTCP